MRILRMATQSGAAALARGDLGRVAAGHEANLVVTTRERLGLASATDGGRLLKGLVWSATARDVAYVISDGRVLVEHGELVGVDQAAIARELAADDPGGDRARPRGCPLRPQLARARRPVADAGVALGAPAPTRSRESSCPRASSRAGSNFAFSGTTFGGDPPSRWRPDRCSASPAAPPKAFASLVVEVPAGATVVLSRGANDVQWTIRAGQEQRTRAWEQPASRS